jgi:hypothetical protein
MSTHQMQLTEEHENTEEWHCPECGRTMLIEWDPWRRTVVEPGDETAAHAGGKGGLMIGSVNIEPLP